MNEEQKLLGWLYDFEHFEKAGILVRILRKQDKLLKFVKSLTCVGLYNGAYTVHPDGFQEKICDDASDILKEIGEIE